jgi:hypothetical protein
MAKSKTGPKVKSADRRKRSMSICFQGQQIKSAGGDDKFRKWVIDRVNEHFPLIP